MLDYEVSLNENVCLELVDLGASSWYMKAMECDLLTW